MKYDIFNSKKEIKEFIKVNYSISVSTINKIERGTALIFNINNKYIVKIFPEKYKRDDIHKEINIINILSNNNIPVPTYLKNKSNDYVTTYKDRIVIMQHYIKGREIETNTGSVDMLIDSANIFGKIVKCLNDNKIELNKSQIESWYSDEAIKEAIIKHQDLIRIAKEKSENIITKDLEYKIKTLKKVKKKFNFDELSNLTCLNTHGDYNVLQCIYNKNNKILAVLDFVSACNMPITWELIRSYSYLDEKAANGTIDKNNLKIYIEEFIKYVDLNKYDLKYMCLLYYIQILTSTYGYKQYLRDSRRKQSLEFATFRTNICKYLEKNMDKISKELCKLKYKREINMNIAHVDIENSKTQKVITLDLEVLDNKNENYVFDIGTLNEDILKILKDAIDKKLLYTDIEMFFINDSSIPYFGPDYDFYIENHKLYANLIRKNKQN